MLKNGWCEARENWLKMIREFPEEQFIKADDFKNQSVSFGLRDHWPKAGIINLRNVKFWFIILE